jgi:hypothetical protein
MKLNVLSNSALATQAIDWFSKSPNAGTDPSSRGTSLSHLIVFTLGYFLGGVTALVVMGLAVAARRGDSGQAERGPIQRGDESTPAWRERS